MKNVNGTCQYNNALNAAPQERLSLQPSRAANRAPFPTHGRGYRRVQIYNNEHLSSSWTVLGYERFSARSSAP